MKYTDNNLYAKITSNKDFFTNIEEKISDVIFENPKKFITYSMSELSEITGVSQGSINNFSKKYAGGGFSELKLRIASELESFMPKQHTIVEKNDGIKDVMKKITSNVQTAFNNTILNNSQETLSRVVEKILHSKRIEIYGIYQSGIIANNFYYRLLELGISATFVSDVLTCSVSASMLDSECLIIAISSSGKTSDIINAVRTGKKNNVPVVCITADMNSPLAKLSDDVLLASSSGTSEAGSPAEILMSQFFILDSIYTYIESKKYKNHKSDSEHYYKLKKILNSHNVRELEINNKEN